MQIPSGIAFDDQDSHLFTVSNFLCFPQHPKKKKKLFCDETG